MFEFIIGIAIVTANSVANMNVSTLCFFLCVSPNRIFTEAPWGPAMVDGGGKVRDKLANYVQANGDLVLRNLLGDDILA